MTAKSYTRKGLGMLLLGIWLVIQGLLPLLRFSIPGQSILLPILALVAGVLIILDR